jgi:hypothetical protein
MPVPNTFANATATIPLSQLDANFATTITLGNTAIQLGNTVTTLNNMTLANVTVTSGNVTLTNVTVTTANVTTANIGTEIVTTSQTLNYGTANGVVYLNASKVSTTGTALVFDGTNLGVGASSPAATLDVQVALPSAQVKATTGTNRVWMRVNNTGGDFYFGRENSAGNSFGVTAYSSLLWSQGAYPMVFATDNTEKMRLDSAGNLGLGVTPSPWNSNWKALDVGARSAFANNGSGNSTDIWHNGYANASGDAIYKVTAAASFYRLEGGAFKWFQAASGTAGNAITFTQAMTLDASGNLGIGTASPARKLDVVSTAYAANQIGGLRLNNTISAAGALFDVLLGLDGSGIPYGSLRTGNDGNSYMTFATGSGPTERARITSGGIFLINTNASPGNGNEKLGISSSGDGIWIDATAGSGGTGIVIDRTASDGDLINFLQAGAQEGVISVSGTTVTYGGGHLARWSQLPNNEDPSTLLKGTVLSNLDEMCEWGEEANEQLNKTKVSDVEGDPNVAGVFVSTSPSEEGLLDFFCAMTGDMIIRIAQGVTVQRGDLLMSAGDGTAKPQGDDIIRSKTVAKVTSTHVTCTYEDGSYCVPCVLMAC